MAYAKRPWVFPGAAFLWAGSQPFNNKKEVRMSSKEKLESYMNKLSLESYTLATGGMREETLSPKAFSLNGIISTELNKF